MLWLLSLACLLAAFQPAQSEYLQPSNLHSLPAFGDTVQFARPGLHLPGPYDPVQAFYSLVKAPDADISTFKDAPMLIWSYQGNGHTIPDMMLPKDPVHVPYEVNYTYLAEYGKFETGSGAMYAWMILNTTDQLVEPGMYGRWDGGVMGMAVFAITDTGAVLTWFDPCLARIGSFGSIPALESWQVIHDSVQFVLFFQKMSGNGWPVQQNLFVLALDDSGVRPALILDFYERDGAAHGNWESGYSWKIQSGNPVLEIVSQGDACAEDWREGEDIPPSLKEFQGRLCKKKFTLYRRFQWSDGHFMPLPDSLVIR